MNHRAPCEVQVITVLPKKHSIKLWAADMHSMLIDKAAEK